jgi:hypothetical protein
MVSELVEANCQSSVIYSTILSLLNLKQYVRDCLTTVKSQID